ncbi:MAG: DNA recombination protein RmuC [Muribaculaceae bacterium]
MESTLIIAIILAVAVAVLAIVAARASRRLAVAQQQAAAAEAARQADREHFEQRLADQAAASEALIKQKEADCERRLADERTAMGERFRALATEILQANSEQLNQLSRSTLETVLSPMRTSLETFTKDFKESYSAESRERLSLREGVSKLLALNEQVKDETARLANALRGDTRVQGHWGEMVLTNILEHSGLEQGRWFVTQDSTTTEQGRVLRPDAVINCPQERKIIIDSKVSLSAYLDWLNAESDAARDSCAKAHVISVRNHIKELADKAYQDSIGVVKGDFVLMFLPHEGAYMLAMSHDPQLWQRAYDSRVIIVSPTHLVTVVRLVEQMWRLDDANTNALRIAERAAKMMDKMAGAPTSLDNVGKALDKAHDAYEAAIGQLNTGPGSVIRQLEQLQQLGVKAKNPLAASASTRFPTLPE